jgi:hypothetical protein
MLKSPLTSVLKTINICLFIFIFRRVLKYEKFEPPPVSNLSSTSLSKSPEFDALPDLNMDLVRAHKMFSRILNFQLIGVFNLAIRLPNELSF